MLKRPSSTPGNCWIRSTHLSGLPTEPALSGSAWLRIPQDGALFWAFWDPAVGKPAPQNRRSASLTVALSNIIGTGSVLQKFGDTMMIGAAPYRLRTPRGECAALHSMALSPAHEKRRDRRRAGATAAEPTRPVPGSAAGESLGIRRVHHAGQDYNLPRSTRTLIAHASRAGADGG